MYLSLNNYLWCNLAIFSQKKRRAGPGCCGYKTNVKLFWVQMMVAKRKEQSE
jgi:hypothetical protein